MCEREVVLVVLSTDLERHDVIYVYRGSVDLEVDRFVADETPSVLNCVQPLYQAVAFFDGK
jgi:hypothetical protein